MAQPNWFDLKYGTLTTPAQLLAALSTDPKIVAAVTEAMARLKSPGPTPAQAFRESLCAALNG